MLLLTIAALMVIATSVFAQEPVRSGGRWAIYPQSGPEDFAPLLTSENLALGAQVTYLPPAGYPPTADEGDATQLTDGAPATNPAHIFRDKASVGWAYQSHVRVTIDLGQVQPVGRVIMRIQTLTTGQDTAPDDIRLALSADGAAYAPVRSRSRKVHPADTPALVFDPLKPEEGEVHAFALDAGYLARYVRLDFAISQDLVIDEIAVLAAEAAEALPPAPSAGAEYRDNVFDRREQFREMIAPGNLSAGIALTYVPKPNYRLTTGESDPFDLTDGQFGERTNERISMTVSSPGATSGPTCCRWPCPASARRGIV